MRPGLDITVLIAPVHDCRDPVTIESGGKRIDPRSLRWMMNPADAGALETALRLRQAVPGTRIRVISMAASCAEPVLRECLAAGADDVLRVCDAACSTVDSCATAVVLASAVRSEHFDLLLCGSRRSDLENGQVGLMVAESLGLPVVAAACEVLAAPTTDRIFVRKRMPGQSLELSCALPAAVTLESTRSLRYPKCRDRRRAQQAPISVVSTEDLGLSCQAIDALVRVETERFTPPKPARRSAAGTGPTAGSTAARIRELIGANERRKSDTKLWECQNTGAIRNVVRHMLAEKIVVP